MRLPELRIAYPDWVSSVVEWDRRYSTDEDAMRLAIAIASENVERATGGPFGAAILESETGKLVAVGMNLVVPLQNSLLHAETVAIMMAESRLGSFSLGTHALPAHTLVSSCDPCAMCLGATLWSGVKRLVCGATRDDASRIRFEEGPVFPESYRYLEARGIEVVREVCRREASEVLERYGAENGFIYNG